MQGQNPGDNNTSGSIDKADIRMTTMRQLQLHCSGANHRSNNSRLLRRFFQIRGNSSIARGGRPSLPLMPFQIVRQ
jgi:hypothetical protein